MSTKHTPEPWEFVGDALYGGGYCDANGVMRHQYQIYPFYDEDRTQGQHGLRHEADKKLIKAAPKLLAACKAARDELRRLESQRNEISSVQLDCIAAIAEAEGRSA